MKDNYLQPIIDKMKWRIGQPDTQTATVEEEIESAIKEVEIEMNKKHGYTGQNRTEQED